MTYQKKLLVALVVGTTNPQPDDIVKAGGNGNPNGVLATISGALSNAMGNVAGKAGQQRITDLATQRELINNLKPIQGATKDGVQVWQDSQTGKRYTMQGSGKDLTIVEL